MGASEPSSKPNVSLAETEADFLRTVLEAVPAYIVRLDPELRIRYINRLQPGFTLDQVIGRSVFDFVDPEHHARQRHAIEEAMSTGRPSGYINKGAGADGQIAYYQCSAMPVDNGDGRRATCVIALDVTEHVARAEALRESEGKLRLALEATGIGLWNWDMLNHTVELDARTLEIVGYMPDTPTEYIASVVHPEDREQVTQEVARAEHGEPRFSVHRVVRPDNSVRWVLPCGQLVKDERGRVVRMYGGLLDVTAQRLTEERLRQAQKLDAVGSLTAGVAHNFNNMLAVIMPALELALRDAVAGQRSVFEDATHAARRSAELITQLMTFAGQRRAAPPRVQDLAPAVERAVSMCQRTFERHVAIRMALAEQRPSVAYDAPAIEQVIVNLLINARDAVLETGRPDPCIQVELAVVDDAHVRVRIADNGTGMNLSVKQRAFEPFFTTKEPGKGTGLGLATSYGIVRDHGGTITLESTEGGGTTADVVLPISMQVASGVRPDTSSTSKNGSGVILVIDDEPAVRRVIELLLLARGHRVVGASDGQNAVERLDAGLRPDLILLDRSMPGWPVRHTLNEIRKRAPSTPLLFFTGEDVTSEERLLVQDVLYKPLSMDELVHAIERWVEHES